MKVKICFVSLNIYPLIDPDCGIEFSGGAEVQQCLIANGLSEEGYDISIVTMDHGQPDSYDVNGIKIFKAYRPQDGIKGFRFFYPRLIGVWNALKRADADVYYQRGAGMITGIVAKYCKHQGKKFIFAGAHDLDFYPSQRKLPFKRDEYMYEWGLKNADTVLVQNQTQKILLKKKYGRVGVLIHNIAKKPNELVSNSKGAIGWLGAIRPDKYPLKFIELARKCPDLKFILIGGPGNQQLWENVKKDACSVNNLELKGHVPNSKLNNVLKDVSVLVNTSDFEGFPNTFLEAWSRGIPTVSFVDIYVSDDVSVAGFVVSSLETMKSAVDTLMSDARWSEESKRAHHVFNKWYTFDYVLDEYKKIFSL